MDISSEMVRTLYEIGMMSAWQGETSDARAIFTGVQSARPNSPLPQLGAAIAFLNDGRYGWALRVLENASKKEPECYLLKWYLALTCKLIGYENRCQSLCSEIIHANQDENAVQMATMLSSIPMGVSPAMAYCH